MPLFSYSSPISLSRCSSLSLSLPSSWYAFINYVGFLMISALLRAQLSPLAPVSFSSLSALSDVLAFLSLTSAHFSPLPSHTSTPPTPPSSLSLFYPSSSFNPSSTHTTFAVLLLKKKQTLCSFFRFKKNFFTFSGRSCGRYFLFSFVFLFLSIDQVWRMVHFIFFGLLC